MKKTLKYRFEYLKIQNNWIKNAIKNDKSLGKEDIIGLKARVELNNLEINENNLKR